MAKAKSKASQKVEKAMHERKRGTLRSGGSGKKVTSRKQAIAIGLSEARREGADVPEKKGGDRKGASASKKTSSSKSSSRKTSSSRAASSKKSGARSRTRGSSR